MKKTLYLECNMGAAGDMLAGALVELLDDKQAFIDEVNNIGIPKTEVVLETRTKCGIDGTGYTVVIDGVIEGEEEHGHHHHGEHEHEHEHHHHGEHEHEHEHHHHGEHEHEHHHHGHHEHNGMHEIEHIISHLNVNQKVKADVIAVYRIIAEAESKAHGKPVDFVHFHEVGAMDAVADITSVCMLIDKLSPDVIIGSPVRLGKGFVKCAHGVLPVPAPATADIVRGIPVYSGDIDGEMCTPTGAALLKHFVSDYKEMPVLSIDKIGYGMGKKDFPKANCVRAFLCSEDNNSDEVYELSANIDDMTAEYIAFATSTMLENGALDVYTTAIGMKNSRPAVKISCLCKEDKVSEMEHCFFAHTTTIGVRKQKFSRTVLDRTFITKDSKFGEIQFKSCTYNGKTKEKAEFSDIAKIAKDNNISLTDVINEIKT